MNGMRAVLGCVLLSLFGCGQGNAEPSPGKFHEGRANIMQGHFQPAIEQLTEHLKLNPEGHLASRATFLIGKAYLGLGDWKAAESWFEKTITKYPTTEEAHKAKYKMAVVKLLQGDSADAKRRFTELAENPSGSYTPEAIAMAKYLDQAESK